MPGQDQQRFVSQDGAVKVLVETMIQAKEYRDKSEKLIDDPHELDEAQALATKCYQSKFKSCD